MVEIWFSILTNQQVRRGVYHDVPELIAAIETLHRGLQPTRPTIRLDQDRRTDPRQSHQTTSHFRNAALVEMQHYEPALGRVAGRAATRTVSFGRGATIQGGLSSGGGQPIVGAAVEVTSTDRRLGARAHRLTPLITDTHGHFTFVARPGASRTFEFAYRAFTLEEPVVRSAVRLNVRAGRAFESASASHDAQGPNRVRRSSGRRAWSGGHPDRTIRRRSARTRSGSGRHAARRRARAVPVRLSIPAQLCPVHVPLPGGRAAPAGISVRDRKLPDGGGPHRPLNGLSRCAPAASASSRGRTGTRSGAGCARGSGSCRAGRRSGSARASGRWAFVRVSANVCQWPRTWPCNTTTRPVRGMRLAGVDGSCR